MLTRIVNTIADCYLLLAIIALLILLAIQGKAMQGRGGHEYIGLESITLQVADGKLLWRATEGSRDEDGKYQPQGEPLDCQLDLMEGTIICGGAERQLPARFLGFIQEDVGRIANHLVELTYWPPDERAQR